MFALLAACQAPPPAPVVDRPPPPSPKIRHHVVAPGETLYAIAWRYEIDFRDLARANGLAPPYRLHPGQRLTLDLSRAPPPAPPVRAPARPKPASQSQPPRRAEPAPRSQPPSRSEAAPPPLASPQPSLPEGGWRWQWPARGRVEREYDVARTLKGVSIYPDGPTEVRAAAPGVVVYAGEGLRGYGRLIIVKHSERLLSAYAHNARILVEENQRVAAGERIAEVGRDGRGRYRLYFEIRDNGVPVDPLALLPKS